MATNPPPPQKKKIQFFLSFSSRLPPLRRESGLSLEVCEQGRQHGPYLVHDWNTKICIMPSISVSHIGWLRKFSSRQFCKIFAKLSISCFAKFCSNFAKHKIEIWTKFSQFRETRNKLLSNFFANLGTNECFLNRF